LQSHSWCHPCSLLGLGERTSSFRSSLPLDSCGSFSPGEADRALLAASRREVGLDSELEVEAVEAAEHKDRTIELNESSVEKV